jgi:voltage-gated potassium channel
MTLRDRIAFYLDDIETPIGKLVTFLITGLVLLSSLLFVAETYALPPRLARPLDLLENIILGLFVVEYGLRFWVAPDRRRYVFSLFSLIDLVTIGPFLLSATHLVIGANLGFLRIFRWFRILRLIRFMGSKTAFGYVSSEDSAIVTRILFTLSAIIFVYSGLIYQVEHPSNSSKFHTFLDAVYFSVSTITTAGFGDITPISQVGRLLTVLMILTGVVLIPWQLGDLLKRLVNPADQLSVTCSGCGLALHDLDARCCKHCGTTLPSSAVEPLESRTEAS